MAVPPQKREYTYQIDKIKVYLSRLSTKRRRGQWGYSLLKLMLAELDLLTISADILNMVTK